MLTGTSLTLTRLMEILTAASDVYYTVQCYLRLVNKQYDLRLIILYEMVKIIKCTDEQYAEISDRIKYLYDALLVICKSIGEPLEGDCFHLHDQTVPTAIPDLIFKQKNLVSVAQDASNILEIGFNAGMSCLLFLAANPVSTIVCFDLCAHAYTRPCFELLSACFPGRLTLVIGDSTVTVPEWRLAHADDTFDLVHIDGCHEHSIANTDFINCYPISSDIIVWDDTQIWYLRELCDKYVMHGMVEELHLHKTQVYEHSILRVLPSYSRIIGRRFYWKHDCININGFIEFLPEGCLYTMWSGGTYTFTGIRTVEATWNGLVHYLTISDDFESLTSIRDDGTQSNAQTTTSMYTA